MSGTRSNLGAHARGRAAPSRGTAVFITETGLYIRLRPGKRPFRTLVRQTWPLVAVDVDRRGRAVGIEVVPLPNRFVLRQIAARAGVVLSNREAAHARVCVRIPLQLARPAGRVGQKRNLSAQF